MKVLLDTHILLWAISNDVRLSEKVRKLIENEENEIYYSIVSLWEVEIKHLLHSEAMPVSAEELAEYCEQSGFQRMVREKHIFALACLKREEDAPPHKDPFDRMLSTENMIFVTHDSLYQVIMSRVFWLYSVI
ncbi:MAG: type II toxin-antitoxin system VapC family toxin [Lachnospiraceae bacterium]